MLQSQVIGMGSFEMEKFDSQGLKILALKNCS